MKKIITVAIIFLCCLILLANVFYKSPTFNDGNTFTDFGVCVSYEFESVQIAKNPSRLLVLTLDNGNKYYFAQGVLEYDSDGLQKAIDSKKELNIRYFKNSIRFGAYEAVEIADNEKEFLTLKETNRSNRGTRIGICAVVALICSASLAVLFIQMPISKKKKVVKKSYKADLDWYDIIKSFAEVKKYKKVNINHDGIYCYLKKSIENNCIIFIKSDILKEKDLEHIKSLVRFELKKQRVYFYNEIYIISVSNNSSCFKSITKNEIKQKIYRKTYYVGINNFSNLIYFPKVLPRSIKRKLNI